MSNKIHLSWEDIETLLEPIDEPGNIIYGVPRGGMIVASTLRHAEYTVDVNDATVIIDDIVDSGLTKEKYTTKYPGKKFFALIDKTKAEDKAKYDGWIVFPWEADKEELDEEKDHVIRLMEYNGIQVDAKSVDLYMDKIKDIFKA